MKKARKLVDKHLPKPISELIRQEVDEIIRETEKVLKVGNFTISIIQE